MKEEHFDTSNYSPDDQLFSSVNKAAPGFFKDETAGYPIKSFIGLRSKVRSIAGTV